mmetsp:Transcript_43029/g.78668  ORF Transcript_43029/g.78668 Transcript_43029/m.78668 type:complete len:357 (+) Transcript_43029:333-1403(+)
MTRNPINLDDAIMAGVDVDFHARPKSRLSSSSSSKDLDFSSRSNNNVRERSARVGVEREGAEVALEQSRNNTNDSIPSPPSGSLRSDRVRKLLRPAPSFYCPLTMVLMKDPVQDREGNSYEKSAILKWLSENDTSPVTRNRLKMKHLIPNRALKEAIEFEWTSQKETSVRAPLTRQKEIYAKKSESIPLPPKQTSQSTGIISTTHDTNHHQIINNLLSNLKVKSRVDNFGIAFLPMKKLQPTINNERINMLMVIHAPPAKETFQLYTHFNASIERQCIIASSSEEQPAGASNENRVFNDLLQHGKHKALTLTKVCEERMRFGFEGKVTEISSNNNLMGILNMFVKVSFRMKKRVEA